MAALGTEQVEALEAQNDSADQTRDVGLKGNLHPIRPSDVVITGELLSRPTRPLRLELEARLLRDITSVIIDDPRAAITRILEALVVLCGAGSAGFSILEDLPDGTKRFRWDAMAGPLDIHIGGTTPRDFSPCGLCLDAGKTILVRRPFAVFEYFNVAVRPLLEGLIAPLYDAHQRPLGTIWVVHHDVTNRFDAEDVRVIEHVASLMVLALKLRDTLVPATGLARPEPDTVPADQPDASDVLFRKLSCFASLSPTDRQTLRNVCGQVRQLPARAEMISEGATPTCVFLALDGIACRTKLRATGSRQIMAYLLPGDLSDLDVSLLSGMDHAITTLTPCKVVQISAPLIHGLMAGGGELARALRICTLTDEAILRQWVMNVGFRSSEERLAHLLCELYVRMRAVGRVSAGGFDLPITQLDLADTAGMSTVHVNRTLQELRRRGLIVWSGSRLEIPSFARLKALAEFDPGYLRLTAPAERG